MGDNKLLDTNQIINGLAVLLSFFVGYKYAIKKHVTADADAKKDAGKGDAGTTQGRVENMTQHVKS